MVFVTVIYVQQKTSAEAPKIVLVRLGEEEDAASSDTRGGSAAVICVCLSVIVCLFPLEYFFCFRLSLWCMIYFIYGVVDFLIYSSWIQSKILLSLILRTIFSRVCQ